MQLSKHLFSIMIDSFYWFKYDINYPILDKSAKHTLKKNEYRLNSLEVRYKQRHDTKIIYKYML